MQITYGKTTPTSYSDPEVQQVNQCALVFTLRDIFMPITIQMPGTPRARSDSGAISGGHVSHPTLRAGLPERDEGVAR
jgi:hypothetical protein